LGGAYPARRKQSQTLNAEQRSTRSKAATKSGGHNFSRAVTAKAKSGFSRRGTAANEIRFTNEEETQMQKVILQEDIEKLGHRGDVVDVKPGYARNFLLPNKLAIEATTGNMKALERIRGALAKKTATEQDAAEKQAASLNGVELKFTRKTGENDQLFGSVTNGDIAEALEAQGYKIDKRQVQLHDPLKTLGDFPVKIKVFREISAEVKVQVAKEE
jgi:large subunit ribosomal protein L9